MMGGGGGRWDRDWLLDIKQRQGRYMGQERGVTDAFKVSDLSLLMKVKEESEKAGSKLNIQKMKIMASGPITSW